MNENLKKFMDMADHDDALQEKLNATSSLEELYAVASSVVDGFTLEEFEAEFAKAEQESAGAELADDDLDGVAGGIYAIIKRRRKASRCRGAKGLKQNGGNAFQTLEYKNSGNNDDAFQTLEYKKGANDDDMFTSL